MITPFTKKPGRMRISQEVLSGSNRLREIAARPIVHRAHSVETLMRGVTPWIHGTVYRKSIDRARASPDHREGARGKVIGGIGFNYCHRACESRPFRQEIGSCGSDGSAAGDNDIYLWHVSFVSASLWISGATFTCP
jgi:hypothetical protein